MEPHQPSKYVCGIYLAEKETWKGEFEMTEDEMFHFMEVPERTEAECVVLLDMISTVSVYNEWWNKVKSHS